MKLKGVVNYANQIKFDSVPSDDDFELIKSFGSGEIDKDKLFVYKVLLCDNECDRDIEQFTHDALVEMSKLFVGKIGIEDHHPTVHNNHSRIYKTELIVDDDRTNYLGKPYEYLVGYAYTLNDDFNKQFIEEIKSGIKKEVSVGVANDSLTCSICGHKMGDGCSHIKGHVYENKTCVGLIDDITDVYEWSFVSIPAQRRAGVIKSKNSTKEESKMRLKDMVIRAINSKSIESDESQELLNDIEKYNDVDNSMKALEDENAQLKSELESAKEEIDAIRVRKLEDQIDGIIDALNPKNDKVREMLRRAIDEMIEVGDDGLLTDSAESAIRAELESDEYRPLFDDKKSESDDSEKGCGSGDVEENKKSKKSFDFNYSSNSANKTFKQESGVMGIRFIDKKM